MFYKAFFIVFLSIFASKGFGQTTDSKLGDNQLVLNKMEMKGLVETPINVEKDGLFPLKTERHSGLNIGCGGGGCRTFIDGVLNPELFPNLFEKNHKSYINWLRFIPECPSPAICKE